MEKLVKNKYISLDLKTELEGIKTKLNSIEKSVNQFASTEQVAEIALSQVTLVLQQISQENTKTRRAATKAKTGVDNSSVIVFGHITPSSTELKTELKEYIDKKFENLLTFITNANTKSIKDVSFRITTISNAQEAMMEQLKNFLKMNCIKS